MSGLSGKEFGILIAYVLPGFLTLWGVSPFSPTVAQWLSASPSGASTVGGLLYGTVASVGVGLRRCKTIDYLNRAARTPYFREKTKR
jgi:hypothetical protein